jgi:hypothetical protein
MGLDLIGTCVRTREEKEAFLESVHQMKTTLTGNVRIGEISELWETLFNSESALIMQQLHALEGGKQIHSFITRVEDTVSHWPVIGLTLAIRPTERLITRLHDWFVHHLGQTVVIDVAYEPSLLAGAVIEWEGQYRDYSLSRKLSIIFVQDDFKKLLMK